MGRKLLLAIVLGLVLCAILVKCDKGCDKSKPVAEHSSLTKVTTEIKANHAVQDTIIAKVDTLQAVDKRMPRIKDLKPKHHRDTVYVRDTVWITDNAECDSLFKVSLYKEMLLDSTFELINDLKFTIVKERGLHAMKDSQNEAVNLKLNETNDSLKSELKKKQGKAYWRGIRHGAIVGYAAGVVTSVVVR